MENLLFMKAKHYDLSPLENVFFALAQATTLMPFAASLLSTLLHAVISFPFIVLGSQQRFLFFLFFSIDFACRFV